MYSKILITLTTPNMLPITQYYRFHATPDAMRHELVAKIMNAGMTEEMMAAHGSNDTRVTVFQAGILAKSQNLYGSPGAIAYLRKLGAPIIVDATSTSLGELPDGLAMLVGDDADVQGYLKRRNT